MQQELISNDVELDFGAISIDNSTLKGEGYKFDEGLLVQVRQFKKSPIKVIQTDIVHNEAIKHIGQEISKTRSSIEQALRSANKQLKIKTDGIENARAILSVDGSDHEVAEKRLQEYYGHIGAEVISSAEYVNLSSLMNMYFSTQPPFETGRDKKTEFPDAIALLALEGWAEENEINVIAVSQDSGWRNYSSSSDRITVVSSLAEALEKFQPHNKVESIIAQIREDSLLEEGNHILQEIESAIINSVDDCDIEIDASSSMYVEWDEISANYISHELDKDNNDLVKVRIVRISDEGIVLKVGATVSVEVEASFDFSVWDSFDREYFGMGGDVISTTESYHTDILVTLTGDFAQDFSEIVISSTEVLETIRHADFGDIEPNWNDDHEDEY